MIWSRSCKPPSSIILYTYSLILFVEIYSVICKFKTAKFSSKPDQMLSQCTLLCLVVLVSWIIFSWLCESVIESQEPCNQGAEACFRTNGWAQGITIQCTPSAIHYTNSKWKSWAYSSTQTYIGSSKEFAKQTNKTRYKIDQIRVSHRDSTGPTIDLIDPSEKVKWLKEYI